MLPPHVSFLLEEHGDLQYVSFTAKRPFSPLLISLKQQQKSLIKLNVIYCFIKITKVSFI